MTDIEALRVRVESLEKSRDRLAKAFVWALFVLIGLTGGIFLNLIGFFRGNVNAPRLTANAFELKDSDGKLRVSLEAVSEGAGLYLHDSAGQVRGELLVTDSRGVLFNLRNPSGARTVSLSQAGFGINEGEVLRVSLDNQDGIPKLVFADSTQQPRLRLILWPDKPYIELVDTDSKPLFKQP